MSLNGIRLWAIGGGRTTPRPRPRARRARRREFADAVAARLREFEAARRRKGLVMFAIDTELLGHWWTEGPTWLDAVLRLGARAGIGSSPSRARAERHESEERPARLELGRGQGPRTWDSPAVADLAWAARRLELRLLRALERGPAARDAAERAARELLAVQASDWAFLDRQAARRATTPSPAR